jgi:hypothetical protein
MAFFAMGKGERLGTLKMIADRGRFASDLIKAEFVKISLDNE